jgi:hypothetical protein
MSSRAWTEVATGAEARSFRRWVMRAALLRIWAYAVLGILLIGTTMIYGRVLLGSGGLWHSCSIDNCSFEELQKSGVPDRDILDILFD